MRNAKIVNITASRRITSNSQGSVIIVIMINIAISKENDNNEEDEALKENSENRMHGQTH